MFGWSRRGAGMLLAVLICAVLAVSGLDSTASAQAVIDYDADNDGLIEVTTEDQLSAIRWDLDGSGVVDAIANATTYSTAFPNAEPQMGCPVTGCAGYELAADISLTSSTNPGWEPIGDGSTGTPPSFTATFEGNGHTISNLFINRTTDNIGLFGAALSPSVIRNVKLTNVNVTGNNYVGALVGLNGDATNGGGRIDNCEAAGTVTGVSAVGGLVGSNYGPISGSSASGEVTATRTDGASLAGGLVGRNDTATISDSHASGNVTGSHNSVGGLVGYNTGSISGSTASGTVTTTGNFVGGLVGWNNGPISDSDALNPSVTGVSYVGGLVGQNDGADGAAGSNAISGSTASGTVTATGSFAGGLVGSNEGPISDSDALNLSVTGLSWVGGLVGFNANAWSISGSTARGTVTATGGTAGGLVGQNTGPISGSSATGTVTGHTLVGGLVGLNNGPISGSSASGEVTATRTDGASRAGGLVGENRSTPISNSHASGDVTGSHDMVGGLVGRNFDALADSSATPPSNAISGSTASGTVTTTGSEVGGLVGWNNGPISDSAALNPSVTGVNSVGGLVGTNVDDEDRENGIDRSIATANVMGTGAANGTGQHVGGLVGFSYGPIRDSYASGAVRGNYQVGGLAGNNVAGVHNSGGRVFNSRADGEVGAGNAAVAAERMGGLVGYSDGRIVGGVATGAVTGSAASSALGGLVGHSRGSISSSAATGAVSGGQQVGGLVGYVATTGTVTESWTSGAVTAIALASALQSGTNVGGLVGWSDGTVGASFATGNVTGVGSAGGLLGLNTGGVIATYATGSVTVSDNASCTGLSCPRVAGGLIGLARKQLDPTSTGSDVQASYSAGSVSGPSGHVVGGLAGKAGRETTPPSYSASFTNSYWDTETSGETLGVASDDEDANGMIDGTETATAGVTGQTTTALNAPTDYTGIFLNWNVAVPLVTARTGGPWDFGAATDYPVLRGLGAPPSVPAGTATLSVAEERSAGTPIGSPLTATDADSSTLSYKLVGADGSYFGINGMTGQLSTKTLLDYENPVDGDRDNTYELMVQASDGMTVAFWTVTVTIRNVNEAPTISGPETIDVDEGHTGTLGTYGTDDPEFSLTNWGFIGDNSALSGPHADRFRFDKETGRLTFAAPPDFEGVGAQGGGGPYEVTVDANDGELHGMLEVTVNVADVEEPGTLTLFGRRPVVGQPTTATLTEPDGVVGTVTWTWHLSTSRTGGGTEIVGATLSSYTPVADDVDNYLTATATYEDGYGPGKTLQAVTEFTTAAANSMNAAPVLPVSVDAIELPENARPGMDVGSPVQATDADNDPISYSLSGEFVIDQGTGQIKVAPDAVFDFDAGQRSYTLTVTASDGFGASDAVGVTVTITNVDEPPVAEDDFAQFDEDTPATIDVLANDSDPEDAKSALTVSVVRGPARGTVVVNDAVDPDEPTITYTPQPNYNGADSFSYQVSDPGGLTSNVATVVLTIYALNDAPEFPATTTTARSVSERAQYRDPVGAPVTAVDVDGDDLTYSLAGSTSFEMLDGTAQITVREGVVLDATDQPTTVTVTVADEVRDTASIDVTITVTTGPVIPPINEPPVAADDAPLSFDEDTSIEIRVLENDSDPEDAKSALTVSVVRGPARGMVVVNDAVDPDGPTITYTPQANYNGADSFSYRVTDSGGLTSNVATVVLTIDALNDAPEFPATTPTARSVSERAQYGDPVGAPVTAVDVDGDDLTYSLVGSTDFEMLDGTAQITVRDGVALDATDQPTTVTVTVADERGATASIAVTITVTADDDDVPVTVMFGASTYPVAEGGTVEVTVTLSADPERRVVIPLTATDQNGASPADYSGVPANLTFNAGEMSKSFTFTAATDTDDDDGESVRLGFGTSLPAGVTAGTTVTTTVSIGDTVAPITPPSGAGGGGGGGFSGGGGGGGPSPSVVDFEWNVTRDIDELDSAHGSPSGMWSDGTTLWVLENGDGADDAVYAYDIETGERVEDREFELDDTNRAPRGVWSDRTLLWVSDSGRNSLFAHDLEAGERLPERDIALAARNRAARGIWSGDETMWVLDGGKDALFAYDLESGSLLAEYELVSANGDPHGLWSDGVTVWVSDHGAKRLFAYRLPAPEGPAAEDAEPQDLERVRDEEFPNTVLSRASNNSPRGLWSDGDVMYVADESDGKVYTYNMPDAIDARLASLSLSGVDIGEFDPGTIDYEGIVDDDLTVTAVEAAAVQDDAVVVIDPPDADEAAEGRQVAVGGGAEITVTVTSADGSREKTYRVRIEETGPSASCLRGAVAEGFSLVVSEGGSIEDLVACAEGRAVTALYTLDGGEYVSYILGAPEPVNEEFVALYADGVPALTPLIAKSEGPPSPAPESDAVPEFGPDCLRGAIVEGFNLVLYEGGSVGDLEACAEGVGLATLYALDDGIWVSYILGAPELVNAAFRELFAGGLPVATPLVGKRD